MSRDYGIIDQLEAQRARLDSVDVRTGFRARLTSMGRNLLWYVPLTAWVLWYFVWANVVAGYENIRLMFRHWNWVLPLVPSVYVFLAVVLTSVLLPVYIMLTIPSFFANKNNEATYRRRYLLSFLSLFGLLAVVVLTQFAIQASFPLCWESNGTERFRLIPFMPCPNR